MTMTARAIQQTLHSARDMPDVLDLYRWAVQDPETHAALLRVVYERLNPGRHAVTLREDFAGTSADAVAWVALAEGRRAVAVERDPETLAWARRRAARILGPRAAALTFIQGDVDRIGRADAPAADIITALNFSVLHLRERKVLVSYLRHARDGLLPGGALVLNLFGGAAAIRPHVERHRVTPKPRLPGDRAVAPFDYLWEVCRAGSSSGHVDCAIHFDLGGRELRDAFVYAWRLWSPRDILAACAEAGFARAQLWRHTYDPARGAQGVFLVAVAPEAVDALPRWTAYVVAQRA